MMNLDRMWGSGSLYVPAGHRTTTYLKKDLNHLTKKSFHYIKYLNITKYIKHTTYYIRYCCKP